MDNKNNIPIKCNEANANNTLCLNDEDNIIFQYKIIISIVFIIILILFGLYIYNLIKCYFPNWIKNKERPVAIANSDIN